MRISSLQQEPGNKQLPLYGKPGRPIEKAALPSNAILFFFCTQDIIKFIQDTHIVAVTSLFLGVWNICKGGVLYIVHDEMEYEARQRRMPYDNAHF